MWVKGKGVPVPSSKYLEGMEVYLHLFLIGH